jgi:signal transduction histidine kinase
VSGVVPVVAFVAAAAVGVFAIPLGLVGWAAAAILAAACLLGVRAGRGIVLVTVPVTAGLFAAAATVVADGWWTGLGPMALAAMLVGASVGIAVRSRREAVEQESRRRIVEERLRIARDVHDLVAHNLAVVTVQAGAAANLLPERPEAAREALDHVRTAGADVLDELGTLLGVLREDDTAPPTEPTPDLTDLDRLLDSFAAAGLRVDHVVSGTAVTLAATVRATAYRVVQESLTNAARHGDGRARLRLTHTPDRLRIEVRNGCVPGQTAGTGHGLAGMRERVAAAGGTLAAGPTPGGEFVVEACLPVAREAR